MNPNQYPEIDLEKIKELPDISATDLGEGGSLRINALPEDRRDEIQKNLNTATRVSGPNASIAPAETIPDVNLVDSDLRTRGGGDSPIIVDPSKRLGAAIDSDLEQKNRQIKGVRASFGGDVLEKITDATTPIFKGEGRTEVSTKKTEFDILSEFVIIAPDQIQAIEKEILQLEKDQETIGAGSGRDLPTEIAWKRIEIDAMQQRAEAYAKLLEEKYDWDVRTMRQNEDAVESRYSEIMGRNGQRLDQLGGSSAFNQQDLNNAYFRFTETDLTAQGLLLAVRNAQTPEQLSSALDNFIDKCPLPTTATNMVAFLSKLKVERQNAPLTCQIILCRIIARTFDRSQTLDKGQRRLYAAEWARYADRIEPLLEGKGSQGN